MTADFERIFTGIGVCYTFNGETPHKYSNKPGSRSGLSLVLNVEQYEYMRGPNNDAGVKVDTILLNMKESKITYGLNFTQGTDIALQKFCPL